MTDVPMFRGSIQGWDFDGWLTLQKDLQSYGRMLGNVGMTPEDPHALSPKERAEYVRMNILAALDELHEALNETPWKPWADDNEGINEEQFTGEIVDALHFIANALAVGAPDVNGKELAARYNSKVHRNAWRWRDGYRGRTDKCPSCGRDKDELPEDHIAISHDGMRRSCNYDTRN
jgi:hypothetical protein